MSFNMSQMPYCIVPVVRESLISKPSVYINYGSETRCIEKAHNEKKDRPLL